MAVLSVRRASVAMSESLAFVKFGDVVEESAALSDPSVVTYDGARSYLQEIIDLVGGEEALIVSMGRRAASERVGTLQLEVIRAFGEGGRVTRLVRFLGASMQLAGLLRGFGGDVTVSLDAGYFASVLWLDAWGRRTGVVMCVTGEVVGTGLSRLRGSAVRLLANSRRTRAVFGRGRFLSGQLLSLGVRPGRVKAYFPAYPPALTAVRRDPTSAADGVIRCAFLGRLSEVKGVRDLPRIAKVLADLGSARLLVIGDGPLRGELEGTIAAGGLDGVVEIGGGLPNRAALEILAGADVMVMPSVSEGIGKSAMEAAIVGVPVVAYAVGGIPDCVENGVNGFLVPPGDVEALAVAVARLSGDRELLSRMRAGARLRGDTLVRLHPTLVDAVSGVVAASASPAPEGDES